MYNQEFKVKGIVELFPMENPWHYVRVPQKYTEMFKHDMVRGLLPVTVTLGKMTWKTSLLPMGDGRHFIPLKAEVRKKEGLAIGDTISLTFSLRQG